MNEVRIEKLARAMAMADSREMILATSDASELHHVSDSGWKDYRHMAIAALAEDAALSPPGPTEAQVEASKVIADWLWNNADLIDFDDMGAEAGVDIIKALEKAGFAALRAMPLQDHAWQDISTEPNDGDCRWYGLHVQHASGNEWFEAHYVSHDDDGQMRLPSADNFDDWAFSDFEYWCDAPPPPAPAMVAEDGALPPGNDRDPEYLRQRREHPDE